MKLSVTLITACSPGEIKMTGHFHHLDVDFPEPMLASPEKHVIKTGGRELLSAKPRLKFSNYFSFCVKELVNDRRMRPAIDTFSYLTDKGLKTASAGGSF